MFTQPHLVAASSIQPSKMLLTMAKESQQDSALMRNLTRYLRFFHDTNIPRPPQPDTDA